MAEVVDVDEAGDVGRQGVGIRHQARTSTTQAREEEHFNMHPHNNNSSNSKVDTMPISALQIIRNTTPTGTTVGRTGMMWQTTTTAGIVNAQHMDTSTQPPGRTHVEAARRESTRHRFRRICDGEGR